MQQYCEDQLQSIIARNSQCPEAVPGGGTVVFDDSGECFYICPVKEPYSRNYFSGTASTMKCFIFQSVTDMFGLTGKSESTAGDAGHTINAVNAFAETSAMLPKRFKQKCNEALTPQ